MTSEARVIEGEVAFSNVETEDQYRGSPTGYNLVVRLSEDDAKFLEDSGVVVKRYEGVPQRKFRTKSRPVVVDVDNAAVSGEIPFGSKVRLAYKFGEAHAEHGVPCYLNRVRVLERAEGGDGGVPDEF